MIASGLEKGSTSALYYASRIEELSLGLFSIALAAALLPAFSEQVAAREVGEMKKTLAFSLKLTAVVSFPAAAGLMALNAPIMRTLFERGAFDRDSTALSASCLIFFAVGLPFVSGVKVVAPAFFSLKDTRTPVVIGIVIMAANTALSLLLMGSLRVGGLALALSLSQILNFVLLLVWLERKVGPTDRGRWLAAAARAAVAAAVMGASLRLAWPALGVDGGPFAVRAAALSGAILSGIAVYLGLLRIISPADFRSVVGLLRKAAAKESSP
jgi:putative peptidoglycan lipid II flippase